MTPDGQRQKNHDTAAYTPSETLDEFMLRMEGVKAPNTLKRIAWAAGKSIQEVVDDIASKDLPGPTAIGGLDDDE